jgi:hypothetical protein
LQPVGSISNLGSAAMNIEKFKILSYDTSTSACMTVRPIENLEEIGQKITRAMADKWIPLRLMRCSIFGALEYKINVKLSHKGK